MPDMPGSGPPDPDSSDRVAAIVTALRSGANPGVKISLLIARLLLTSTVAGNRVIVGGIDHYVYEVNGYALLSPSVT